MSQTPHAAAAGQARQKIAAVLGELQQASDVPPSVLELLGGLARAMGPLFQLERGSEDLSLFLTARSALQQTLEQVQASGIQHPGVSAATEAIAASLGVIFRAMRDAGMVPQAAPTTPEPAAPAPAPAPAPSSGGPRVKVIGIGDPAPPAAMAQSAATMPDPAHAHAPMAAAATEPAVQPFPLQQQPSSAPVAQPFPVAPAPAPAVSAQPFPVASAPAPAPAPVSTVQPFPIAPAPAPAAQPFAMAPAPASAAAPAARAGAAGPIGAPATPPRKGSIAMKPVSTVPVGPNGLPRLETEVGVHSESNFYTDFLGDIRANGGVFVSTVHVLPVGVECEVVLTFPGNLTGEVRGVVRWVREGGGDNARPGLGIQFVQVAADSWNLIERFIRHREPIIHDV